MTDYRRTTDPGPPTGTTVLDGPGLDDADLRDVVRWVRVGVAAAFGLGAALWLGLAVVVALTAQHALEPERPLAAVAVVLSVPEARAALADDMIDDLERDNGKPFTPEVRVEMAEALDAVLGSDELIDQMSALPVVDGRIDGGAIMTTISDELTAQAAGRSDDVRLVLERAARELPAVADKEGTTADVTDTVGVIKDVRRYAFFAAAGLLVPALVCGAVSMVVARRCGLAAALIASGGLLLATTALAPGRFVLEHLPGSLALPGGVLAGLGALVGSGWLWTVALVALVPPAVWWGVRTLRTGGRGDEVAGPHWVP